MQFFRLRKEMIKVNRRGVTEATILEIMEIMEGFKSSKDFMHENII